MTKRHFNQQEETAAEAEAARMFGPATPEQVARIERLNGQIEYSRWAVRPGVVKHFDGTLEVVEVQEGMGGCQ